MQARVGFHHIMTNIRRIKPEDRNWVVEQHIAHYRNANGFDDSFGTLVGEIVDGFIANHDPDCEAGWIAEQAGVPVGCIFCVKLDAATAQLRLFLLVPEARGAGIGRLLLNTCMNFAESSGFQGMRLWTHQSHAAACALYRRSGWSLVDARQTRSFGRQEVIETYEYQF